MSARFHILYDTAAYRLLHTSCVLLPCSMLDAAVIYRSEVSLASVRSRTRSTSPSAWVLLQLYTVYYLVLWLTTT